MTTYCPHPDFLSPPGQTKEIWMALFLHSWLVSWLVALEVYKERLEPNKIEEHLNSYAEDSNKLCETGLKLNKMNKTDPWSIEELEEALKDLGNNKSRDALEYANELFKEGVAGSDLKLATLILMNQIKDKQQYPEALDSATKPLL